MCNLAHKWWWQPLVYHWLALILRKSCPLKDWQLLWTTFGCSVSQYLKDWQYHHQLYSYRFWFGTCYDTRVELNAWSPSWAYFSFYSLLSPSPAYTLLWKSAWMAGILVYLTHVNDHGCPIYYYHCWSFLSNYLLSFWSIAKFPSESRLERFKFTKFVNHQFLRSSTHSLIVLWLKFGTWALNCGFAARKKKERFEWAHFIYPLSFCHVNGRESVRGCRGYDHGSAHDF